MSTSANGPDSGTSDEQGTGGGTTDGGAPDSARTPDLPGAESGGTQPAPGSRTPYPQHASDHGPSRQGPTSPPYQPPPHQPGPYQPDAYQPDAYQPGPYQPDAYQPGPYQPGSYPQENHGQGGYGRPGQAQDGHAPGGYAQGGYGQGAFGRPYAPQKSRVVAGILGILLGSLGIHRFYLGHTTIGIVQLLMSTVGAVFTFGLSAIAAGIWGLIEGILILVGTDQFRQDAQGIPLKD